MPCSGGTRIVYIYIYMLIIMEDFPYMGKYAIHGNTEEPEPGQVCRSQACMHTPMFRGMSVPSDDSCATTMMIAISSIYRSTLLHEKYELFLYQD